MKATSGGQRRTFYHDKPTHDGVTGTTQISKRTMPPLLRLDSIGEVSSVSFGPGERMGQHKVQSNRCHSVNKAVIATTKFLNNLVGATPMSAHSAAPMTHGHHLPKEEMSFLASRVVNSASTMATFEKERVVKASSPQSKDDRYGQWGKRYPLMPPGIFPCHVFNAMQSQMQFMNLPKEWYSPFIAGNGIVGSVSDSVLDRLSRTATRRETSFSEVVNSKSPQMPSEERNSVCEVPVNQTVLAESGAAMGEMCCDESTPSAPVLNKVTDFSSCASSTSSSSKSQNSPQTELRGASSVDSEDDFSEEENDNGKTVEVEEEDDIIFEDSVDGAALPSCKADLYFNSGDDDNDDDDDDEDDGFCIQQLSEVKSDDSSDWDDEEDIDEDRAQGIESCSFGLAFKSLASFLPGHKKCSSENILANNTWLSHYGPEQLPSNRSSVKVS